VINDRTKQKWVDGYLKRTGQKPTWEQAGILSGLFANDAASKKKFDALLVQADDGIPGKPYDWKKVIEDTFDIKGSSHIDSIKCRYVEAAFTYNDWAFVCLPEKVDIDKLTPFVALSLLATVQEDNPEVKNLAITKRTDTPTGKPGCRYSRFILTKSTISKNEPSLSEKLAQLSKSCISNEYMLSSGVFESAFKYVMSAGKDNLDEKILFGDGFGGGESTDSHAKLLMPPRFNFTKPIEVIKSHFSAYEWHHNLNNGNSMIKKHLGNQ
jgi:hypothetical protein